MEALFRELVETNKDILNEIRLLRQEFAAWQARSDAPAQSPVQNLMQDQPDQPHPQPQSPWRKEDVQPAVTRPTPTPKSVSLPDPADFGLTETPKSPPPRYSSQDLEDLRGALLEGVKQRNKHKRDAFAEFEKLHNR